MPLELINEDWQGNDPTVGLCLLHPPDELLGSVQNFPNTKGSVCRNPALQGMLHVHMGQTNFNYMILFFSLSDSQTYAGHAAELVHDSHI